MGIVPTILAPSDPLGFTPALHDPSSVFSIWASCAWREHPKPIAVWLPKDHERMERFLMSIIPNFRKDPLFAAYIIVIPKNAWLCHVMSISNREFWDSTTQRLTPSCSTHLLQRSRPIWAATENAPGPKSWSVPWLRTEIEDTALDRWIWAESVWPVALHRK